MRNDLLVVEENSEESRENLTSYQMNIVPVAKGLLKEAEERLFGGASASDAPVGPESEK